MSHTFTRQTRGSRGFTLIELLVVIAVIAVLAAILFPVFAKAREKSRQTACTSNQRQITTAIQIYAQDNEQTMPSTQGDITANWRGKLSMSEKIFNCPSGRGDGTATAPEYGMNGALFGVSLDNIIKPEITILVADCQSAKAANVTLPDSTALDTTRHGKGYIAAFVDGHAQMLQSSVVPAPIGLLKINPAAAPYVSVDGQTSDAGLYYHQSNMSKFLARCDTSGILLGASVKTNTKEVSLYWDASKGSNNIKVSTLAETGDTCNQNTYLSFVFTNSFNMNNCYMFRIHFNNDVSANPNWTVGNSPLCKGGNISSTLTDAMVPKGSRMIFKLVAPTLTANQAVRLQVYNKAAGDNILYWVELPYVPAD
jgi:prepilin-type N-terminal cleavage/methylation domain-containing protein/prepilin-type processing-associated H-X9-DG protein